MAKRRDPNDVFTPRLATVNPEMYVQRASLEKNLVTALRGGLHIVIHGESGTGKSWLYKKVLADQGAVYYVANLANASRFGSITAELSNIVDRGGNAVKTGYDEEKSAGASIGFGSGKLTHKGRYRTGQMEPFESCLSMLRKRAKSRSHSAALVFDNLEAIFNKRKLLKELADLLILCDDERYAQYNVRIIIVGIPSGIKEYFYKTPHHSTISNRLHELPEVSRLTQREATELLHTGIVDLLRYECKELGDICRHVNWVTDRVPIAIHEYGLELALIAESHAYKLTRDALDVADQSWMRASLNHTYAVIESHMNERDTKVGRRNQALYALGYIDGEHFKAPDIASLIQNSFPAAPYKKSLNIGPVLAQLAGGDRPVVKRSPKGDAYSFVDPRYRMVLRAMLFKNASGRVGKRPMSR